jgi:hypothetical protein
MPDGLRAYKWNGSGWKLLSTNTTFTDQAGWKAPKYYTTIQTAALNGGQANKSWHEGRLGPTRAIPGTPLGQNTTLTLADDPWAASASYYRIIQAGDIDGDGKADLMGRGPYGIRTWFFNRRGTGAWEGFLPYGYPPFPTTGQKNALSALTTLAKNLPQSCSPLPQSDPSVRSRYDGTTKGSRCRTCKRSKVACREVRAATVRVRAPPTARFSPTAPAGTSKP